MLKIAYHSMYRHSLPLGHRFPMGKYELLHDQLLHEGTCKTAHFFQPVAAQDAPILACHTPAYLKDLKELIPFLLLIYSIICILYLWQNK